MEWSRHPRAPWFLAALSFAESAFFPVPPDVMLAPMSLGQPAKAWRFALITTLASVAGGILGYLIGMLAFDLVSGWLHQAGYYDKYLLAREWFDRWGFWAVFVAGFSPIPYKVFTITAGVISMSFLPFVAASFVGRGARFFLVAALMAWGGPAMEQRLHRYMDWIGWSVVALVVLALLIYRSGAS
jgi:membrane protein YqaA with SNARE-associated domain